VHGGDGISALGLRGGLARIDLSWLQAVADKRAQRVVKHRVVLLVDAVNKLMRLLQTVKMTAKRATAKEVE